MSVSVVEAEADGVVEGSVGGVVEVAGWLRV
jgi:hypothetical protein